MLVRALRRHALLGILVGLWPLAASSATPIYRSVGVGPSAPLVSGTGTLTITSLTATFTARVPDNVGVGDVIEYDSNNDGARDTLAFIYSRDATSQISRYSVRTASGAMPVPTAAATAQWAIFRAYTSLDNATQGLENPGIGAARRDFDSAVNGKDIVAADESWNFACYADGVDTTTVGLCNSETVPGLEACSATGNHGWRTDATHQVRIYTPVGPTEVGVSQRHNGTWGTGYTATPEA